MSDEHRTSNKQFTAVDRREAGLLYERLREAFAWAKSTHGFEYWEQVSLRLRDIASGVECASYEPKAPASKQTTFLAKVVCTHCGRSAVEHVGGTMMCAANEPKAPASKPVLSDDIEYDKSGAVRVKPEAMLRRVKEYIAAHKEDDTKAPASNSSAAVLRSWSGVVVDRNLSSDLTIAADEIERLQRQLSEEEDAHAGTMHERDRATEFADDLATAIGTYTGDEIGEHSNLNCPWEEALEIMQARISKRSADEPSGRCTCEHGIPNDRDCAVHGAQLRKEDGASEPPDYDRLAERGQLLFAVSDWISSAPHGDNCFVTDEYPGNQCVCGKDALVRAMDDEFGVDESSVTKGAEPPVEGLRRAKRIIEGQDTFTEPGGTGAGLLSAEVTTDYVNAYRDRILDLIDDEIERISETKTEAPKSPYQTIACNHEKYSKGSTLVQKANKEGIAVYECTQCTWGTPLSGDAHETFAAQPTTWEAAGDGSCKHCGLSWFLHIAEDGQGRTNVCTSIRAAQSENDAQT